MTDLTIKTIGDNDHQIKMGDYELIVLSEIAEKLSGLGGMVIDTYQMNLNDMVEVAVKAKPHMTADYIKTMSYINEVFLFIAMSQRNAEDLSQKLMPVSRKIGELA